MLSRIAILCLAMAVTACGRKTDAPEVGSGPAVVVTVSSLEKALRAIPPERREAFQKAVACENAKRIAGGERRIVMTAQGVRDMLARMASDPAASNC